MCNEKDVSRKSPPTPVGEANEAVDRHLGMIGALPKELAIAMVCHETNRAYCRAIGDYSQPPWEAAPTWQTDSAVKGALFHLEHPEATASASHESWLAEKEATGWKYGLVKDPERKEHPCFVPFDQLPPEQQAKDRLFKAVVEALR